MTCLRYFLDFLQLYLITIKGAKDVNIRVSNIKVIFVGDIYINSTYIEAAYINNIYRISIVNYLKIYLQLLEILIIKLFDISC